jgi:hypothetical protein
VSTTKAIVWNLRTIKLGVRRIRTGDEAGLYEDLFRPSDISFGCRIFLGGLRVIGVASGAARACDALNLASQVPSSVDKFHLPSSGPPPYWIRPA